MRDASTRVLTAATLLIVIWGVVYWVWQPGPRDAMPLVAFDAAAAGASGSAVVGPGVVVDPLARPANRGGGAAPDAALREQRAPREQRAAKPTAPVVERVEPPQFREYTVRPGDTLASIAAGAFGERGKWDVIARSNPGIDPNALRVGMVIRVPLDPDNVQGRVVGAAGDAGGGGEGAGLEYTVKTGDTLSSIAAKFYGSTRYMDVLFEANRDRLRSRNALKVGQVLRVPPKPAQE